MLLFVYGPRETCGWWWLARVIDWNVAFGVVAEAVEPSLFGPSAPMCYVRVGEDRPLARHIVICKPGELVLTGEKSRRLL